MMVGPRETVRQPGHNPFELCEDLHVDEDTLRFRIATLTAEEHRTVVRRLVDAHG